MKIVKKSGRETGCKDDLLTMSSPGKGDDSCVGMPVTKELPQGGSIIQEDKKKQNVCFELEMQL